MVPTAMVKLLPSKSTSIFEGVKPMVKGYSTKTSNIGKFHCSIIILIE